jgi:hypothetical protein
LFLQVPGPRSPTPGFQLPPRASFLASGPRKSQIPNPAPMAPAARRVALISRTGNSSSGFSLLNPACVRFREPAAAAGRRWGWSCCCWRGERGWRRRDAGVGAESGDHVDRLRDERHLHRLRLRAPHLRPRSKGRRRRRGRRRGL